MSAARSIPPEEWEAHKADISALYLAEKKTLVEVMKLMEEDHGFCARLVVTHSTAVDQILTYLQQGTIRTEAEAVGHRKEPHQQQVEVCCHPDREAKVGRERYPDTSQRPTDFGQKAKKGDNEICLPTVQNRERTRQVPHS